MLFRYFYNDFELVPGAPVITGIAFISNIHINCISTVKSVYFKIFSASLLITFQSPEIVISLTKHVPYSLP